MRTTLSIITVSLIALFTACKGQQGITNAVHRYGSDKDPLFFSLERTPCFGKCPTYVVTIDKEGHARYEGKRYADREGIFIGQVSPDVMALLAERAKSINFFGLNAKYDGQVTDLPSTIIRVNMDGKDHTVMGRYQTPKAFKAFATYADSLLAPVMWAPEPAKP